MNNNALNMNTFKNLFSPNISFSTPASHCPCSFFFYCLFDGVCMFAGFLYGLNVSFLLAFLLFLMSVCCNLRIIYVALPGLHIFRIYALLIVSNGFKGKSRNSILSLMVQKRNEKKQRMKLYKTVTIYMKKVLQKSLQKSHRLFEFSWRAWRKNFAHFSWSENNWLDIAIFHSCNPFLEHPNDNGA